MQNGVPQRGSSDGVDSSSAAAAVIAFQNPFAAEDSDAEDEGAAEDLD